MWVTVQVQGHLKQYRENRQSAFARHFQNSAIYCMFLPGVPTEGKFMELNLGWTLETSDSAAD